MEEGKAVVAILDAGSQYSKVIDRRVRQLAVHSEIVPLDTPLSELATYKALIVSGGPGSVTAAGSPQPADLGGLFGDGMPPVLGICYGMQLMAQAYGGEVVTGEVRQDGVFGIDVVGGACPLFGRLQDKARTEVLLTHGDAVVAVGAGVEVVARSEGEGIIAAIAAVDRPQFGVQFHPEVDLTAEGLAMLEAFLFDVAGVPATYTLGSRQESAIEYIRAMVGDDAKVLVLVSGGVDSSVCATLVKEAIGPERVVCIHVDNGFMRKNESAAVADALAAVGLSPIVIDGATRFYTATTEVDGVDTLPLNTVINPEHKRKIIGDTFMRVTNEKATELGLNPDAVFLAQGTLRPDLIESASKLANASANAAVIKTHHNDTALVRLLRDAGRVVEPLQQYHKDEVRLLGLELGLPPALVERQPFPGPGLAIRILCTDAPFVPPTAADAAPLLAAVTTDNAAYSAGLLPVATVGVQGDGRSYSGLAAVFGPPDATAADIDWPFVFGVAKKLPKRARAINRVCFAFGGAPDADALSAVTPTRLTPDVIAQLQEADAAVNAILADAHLLTHLAQVPVVSVPASFGEPGARAILIRTMITNDFMTGVAATPGSSYMPYAVLDDIVAAVLAVPGITRVLYDCTSKPPATTEVE